MNHYEVQGTYGSSQTPCTIYVYDNRDGSKWYCVEGSKNVNKTNDDLDEGVDVEYVGDIDTFTCSEEINSLADLVIEIEY
jgi:hypothetical protein